MQNSYQQFSDQTLMLIYNTQYFTTSSESMTDKKQQQMKEEIASYMAKKDYYDILGVSKTATEPEIKKAYRTLALRFHPDKNQVPGAKEAFNHISHAYTVLIDPEKRQHYDRFGPQTQPARPQNRHRNAQADYEFQEYDDIFRMFFGQSPMHQHFRQGGPQFRTYTYTFGNNFQQGQPQQQQRGFNFYYILLAFFIIYNIAPFFQSKPSYSSLPSNQHKFKTKTSILQTEFYVSQKYFEEIKDQNFKRHSEMVIDRDYLIQLERRCESKKKEKKRWQDLAYRQSPGGRRQNYLAQARGVDLSPCRMINDFRQHHQDYVRDLTYMK